MTVCIVGIFDVWRRGSGSLRTRCQREFLLVSVDRDSFIVITEKEMTYWRELSRVSVKGQKNTLYKLNTLCLFHPLPLLLPFDTSFLHPSRPFTSCPFLFCFVLFPQRLPVFEHGNMDLIGATGVVITCGFHKHLLFSGEDFIQTAWLTCIYPDQKGICCLSFTSDNVLNDSGVSV